MYEGLLEKIDELKELALKTKRISIQDMESIKNEVFHYENYIHIGNTNSKNY